MRKNLLLLILVCFILVKGYGQTSMKADTVVGLKPSYKTGSVIGGFGSNGVYLGVTNLSSKTYHGYVGANYNTNHRSKPGIANYGTPAKINQNDTAWIGLYIYVDTVYFRADSSNIIVVWPTGNGITSQDSVKVSVTIKTITDIQAYQTQPSRLRFYPNPAKDIVHLDFQEPGVSIKNIEITDMSGRAVNNFTWDNNALDVEKLPVGIYIVRLRFSDGVTEQYKLTRGLGIQ